MPRVLGPVRGERHILVQVCVPFPRSCGGHRVLHVTATGTPPGLSVTVTYFPSPQTTKWRAGCGSSLCLLSWRTWHKDMARVKVQRVPEGWAVVPCIIRDPRGW